MVSSIAASLPFKTRTRETNAANKEVVSEVEVPVTFAIAEMINKVFDDTSIDGEGGHIVSPASYVEFICYSVSCMHHARAEQLDSTRLSIDLWSLTATTGQILRAEECLRAFRGTQHWPSAPKVTLLEMLRAIMAFARDPAEGDA